MHIKMLDTVEDSHGFFGINKETGKPSMLFDVRKFYKGEIYGPHSVPEGTDWERRAKGFVNNGYAVEVDPPEEAGNGG